MREMDGKGGGAQPGGLRQTDTACGPGNGPSRVLSSVTTKRGSEYGGSISDGARSRHQGVLPATHAKEMNFLSAHRSSNPTTPAMQSVSEMCRNEVDESVCGPGRSTLRPGTVVWANLSAKVYHFSGYKDYGKTKNGTYMCEKDVARQGFMEEVP